MLTLRPYQQTADDQIVAAWAAGAQNVLLVMPCRTGKTVIFANRMLKHPGACVAIAHRQELVGQMSRMLARYGIKHRVIGPKNVVKAVICSHIIEFGRDFYDPSAHVAVAGVDTLVSWAKPDSPHYTALQRFASQITLWICDECFPAGTLIDGRPIESIVVGDYVTAFNENDGTFKRQKVTNIFKNLAPKYMMSIDIQGHHVLDCTAGHPFWTKRGWIKAIDLTITDEVFIYDDSNLHNMWGTSRINGMVSEKATSRNRAGVLWKKMLRWLSFSSIFGDNGKNQPQACVKTNDRSKSDEQSTDPRKNGTNTAPDWTQTPYPGRQWQTSTACGSDFGATIFGSRLCSPSNHKNECWSKKLRWISDALQSGFRTLRFKIGTGGRRFQSRSDFTPGAGPEKRIVSTWARVDRVTVQQYRDIKLPSNCHRDGYVHNIEVENYHTYIANNVVVHNCHHCVGSGIAGGIDTGQGNKWGRAIALFPRAKGLGVTATPVRTDGKGLGRHADGPFDVMVEGPTMREAISGLPDGNGGVKSYLNDYRVVCPPSNLDLSGVGIGADGDFIRKQLALKTRASNIMGHVVDEYGKRCRGKLGVTFAPDVETASAFTTMFNNAGVPAELVTAKTPDKLRTEVLKRFTQRRLTQLVNVDLFGEGVDLPSMECVSMARATASFGLYTQQWCRPLTISEGKTEKAWIIDHVENIIRHNGPPDQRCVWTLDRRERRTSSTPDDVIPMRVCDNPDIGGGVPCAAPYERVLVACPYCGWVPTPASRTAPELVDGDLFELDEATLAALRGEVAKVDRHPDDIRRGLERSGASPVVCHGAAKQHAARQEAQRVLRDSMAWFMGYQREYGRSIQEAQRRFFHAFGCDVLTAQALGRPEAEELTGRIYRSMGRML